MEVWDRYLHSVSFDTLSLSEQKRYLSYEYGYAAVAVDQDLTDADMHLADLASHIKALAPHMDQATHLTYRSSLAAYEAKRSSWKVVTKGLESYRLATEAYRLAPSDPFVMVLKANVEFYAPKPLGSKEQALAHYRAACHAYEQAGDTAYNWLYVQARMTAIQCLEKVGSYDEAVTEARRLLTQYPAFVFLSRQYLPSLCKKTNK